MTKNRPQIRRVPGPMFSAWRVARWAIAQGVRKQRQAVRNGRRITDANLRRMILRHWNHAADAFDFGGSIKVYFTGQINAILEKRKTSMAASLDKLHAIKEDKDVRSISTLAG